MRAVLVKDGQGPIENLYFGQVDKPVPKEGQVVVRIIAFGVNRLDLMQREGNHNPPPGASTVLGVEFSGRVEQLGPGVTKWAIGDQVFGLAGGCSSTSAIYHQGAYAEYIESSQDLLIRKPTHLSWIEAASIPENFITAFQAVLKYGELKENDDVLIHAGASGVGVAAIQIARTFGARTVTATASSKAKLDWLLSIPNGATHVANYKTEDFSQVVKKATNGKGVDIVVDFVGPTHWERNINSLAMDGRMIMLAIMSGREVPSVDLGPILYRRLKIQGSTLRSRSEEYQSELINRYVYFPVEPHRKGSVIASSAVFQDMISKITGGEKDGQIRTYIHKVYPWTEIQEAHREMAENKNSLYSGKIICVVDWNS
ncbi:quinone oxidoreductase putative [Scleroderma citrinum]